MNDPKNINEHDQSTPHRSTQYVSNAQAAPRSGDQAHVGQVHVGSVHAGKSEVGSKNPLSVIREHPLFFEIALAVLVVLSISGYLYWQGLQDRIYIEKAEISAPIISIGPQIPGTIDKYYVNEGDYVSSGQVLALVGGQPIYAKAAGLILYIKNTPGQMAFQQDALIKMIDPHELRVVGRIQEDKGLNELRPGQRAVFTVDAFGSKEFEGTLESVSPTARQSDIVFSISDKREEREFEFKVLFDSKLYSDLKNGMSAKIWIYK